MFIVPMLWPGLRAVSNCPASEIGRKGRKIIGGWARLFCFLRREEERHVDKERGRRARSVGVKIMGKKSWCRGGRQQCGAHCVAGPAWGGWIFPSVWVWVWVWVWVADP
jgi:hypothetical protein